MNAAVTPTLAAVVMPRRCLWTVRAVSTTTPSSTSCSTLSASTTNSAALTGTSTSGSCGKTSSLVCTKCRQILKWSECSGAANGIIILIKAANYFLDQSINRFLNEMPENIFYQNPKTNFLTNRRLIISKRQFTTCLQFSGLFWPFVVIFSLSGYAYAFDKINTLNQNTPYDYNSVMQYHRWIWLQFI